jgi:putative hydrolase of the HAD superfamily
MDKGIEVIGFDADDTLWINETYYLETENEFCRLLAEYRDSSQKISAELYQTETANMRLYGYGIKAFTLSLVETALQISNNSVPQATIEKIINLGKDQLDKPLVLLDNVKNVLDHLSREYRLIVVTKGDLLDQESKLQKSKLEKYFHHIEIMSDKKESDYRKLLNHLDINPSQFMMVGNSLRSDIIPILNIGGSAVYVPFHTTWEHETADENSISSQRFRKIEKISQVADIIDNGSLITEC